MSSEQGSATLLSIIVMMLLASLGASLLLLSHSNLQIATNHRDGMVAQYLAESGIQWAVVKLKTDPQFVVTTETTKQDFTAQSLGISPTVGIFKVQVETDSTTKDTTKRLITAVGKVNKAERQVVANITLPLSSADTQEISVIWSN